jgi:hypothetical protein
MTSHKLRAAVLASAMVIAAPLAKAEVTTLSRLFRHQPSARRCSLLADDRLGRAQRQPALGSRGGQDAQLGEIKAKSTVSDNERIT